MTGGKAFPQCTFHHWQEYGDDPFEEGSKAEKIILEIRKRKGLKVEMPKFEKFNDKLWLFYVDSIYKINFVFSKFF